MKEGLFIGGVVLALALLLGAYHFFNNEDCKKLCDKQRANYAYGTKYETPRCYCERDGALYLKKVY